MGWLSRWTAAFAWALVLAHKVGHRIGVVRQFRWPDIDFEAGYGYVAPAMAKAIAEAEPGDRGYARASPHTNDPSKCITYLIATRWRRRAGKLAGLEPKHRSGWHPLRRKFASDLMDQLKFSAKLAARGHLHSSVASS